MKEELTYCKNCVFEIMCGKKKTIQMEQYTVSQKAKALDKGGNITFCLDRKLIEGTENDCIRIIINGQDIAEYAKGAKDAVEKEST